MMKNSALVSLLFSLLMLWHSPLRALDEEELLDVNEAFVPEVTVEGEQVSIRIKAAQGYYLYKERLSLQAVYPEQVKISEIAWPAGELKVDEFFGEMHHLRDVIDGTGTLSFPNGRPQILAFNLKYQGCADSGVCYPPQTRNFAMGQGVPTPDAQTVSGITDPIAPLSSVAMDVTAPMASTMASASPTDSTLLANEPVTTGLVEPAPPVVDPLGLNKPTPAIAGVAGVGDALPEDQAFRAQAVATDGKTILVRIESPADYYVYRDRFKFALDIEGVAVRPVFPEAKNIEDENFGQVAVFFGGVEFPLSLTRTSGVPAKGRLAIEFQGCKENSVCYPPMQRLISIELPSASAEALAPAASAAVAAAAGATAATSAAAAQGNDVGLLSAIVLAILGGILLNLMPCVLPVLSLKVMGLVESGESQAKAKTQAFAYTAGVLISFFVLGLILLSIKGAGNNFSWGMQLQNPIIVLSLAALMVAMGLNLSGVFSFGHGLAGVGSNLTEDSGAKGAFFSGVLACIVATPCTGPFMFTALGYAFTQSNTVAMIVLLALGFGLALPFLLIALVPSFAKALPKPGAWMESLKQWLAFPLYGSAIWLMNVFAHQSNIDASSYAWAALLLLSAGLWWWDRQRFNESAGLSRAFAAVVVLAAIGCGIYSLNLRESEEGTVPFSETAIQDALAQQRVVFVDMTAAWCDLQSQ
jgi:thiol:disulfide interchange protein